MKIIKWLLVLSFLVIGNPLLSCGYLEKSGFEFKWQKFPDLIFGPKKPTAQQVTVTDEGKPPPLVKIAKRKAGQIPADSRCNPIAKAG